LEADGDRKIQRFLRREDVEYITGLATATLYEQMARGDFPRPIRITPRRVAWLESDITEWQKAKIAAAARHGQAA
jgi:prophage regulatory protein